MTIRERVPLAPRTTFKIGGPARYLAGPTSSEEVIEAVAFAREKQLPIVVLGGGSNILIADDGVEALVLMPELRGVEVVAEGETATVHVAAGEPWDAFVEQMVARGYHGLEALSGIPGTVGGAVVANVGAYGSEIADVLESVSVFDLNAPALVEETIALEACAFAYHDSVFSQEPDRFLILGATLRLTAGGEPDFSYRDNRFNFTDVLTREALPHTFDGLRTAVLRIREQKGLLEQCYQSAGSFFHMPYVSGEEYAHIEETARSHDADKEAALRPWAWRQTDGRYKIAPGFLLEYTPFHKGFVRGAVGISPKHSLSVINVSGATAREIAELAADMHDEVQKLFNISLEREVRYIGNVEK